MAARNSTKTAQSAAEVVASAAPEVVTSAEETSAPVDISPAADATEQQEKFETPTDKLTNVKIDNEAKSMKAILDARPKQTVKIKGAEGATPVAVGVNGYVYHVPVNQKVEVPDVVADLLEAGNYI